MSRSMLKQKDNVLIINLQDNIKSEKLENLSNDQVNVDYFDVKHSIPDVEKVIDGTHPIALDKHYDKIIIKAHGHNYGKRKTPSEEHTLLYLQNITLPVNKTSDGKVKTEDLIKHLVKIYENVDEVILNGCKAGSIRSVDELPCTITAIAPAKHATYANMTNRYIKRRMDNYNRTKDPCRALGESSMLFPITTTLLTKDISNKNIIEVKAIAPKYADDINRLPEFLSDTEPAIYSPKYYGKQHQHRNIQFRNITSPSDMSAASATLNKIMESKAQYEKNLGKQDIQMFVKEAATINVLENNWARTQLYDNFFKNKYREEPCNLLYYILKATKDKPSKEQWQIAEGLYKFGHTESKELDAEDKLLIYAQLTNSIKPSHKAFLKMMLNDITAILSETNLEIEKGSKPLDNISKNILEYVGKDTTAAVEALLDDISANILYSAGKDTMIKFCKELGNSIRIINPRLSKEYLHRHDLLKKTSQDTVKFYDRFVQKGYRIRDEQLFSMAKHCVQLKDYSKAQEYCDKALKQSPFPKTYEKAIQVFQNHNPQLALRYIKFFELQNPNKAAEYLLNIGDKVKSKQDANKYYRQAENLALDPKIKFECQIKNYGTLGKAYSRFGFNIKNLYQNISSIIQSNSSFDFSTKSTSKSHAENLQQKRTRQDSQKHMFKK